MNTHFKLKLKELREKAGLSQAGFAKKINLAQSTIGMWESGQREPDFNTTEKIADYFNVSVDYLLGRKASSLKGQFEDFSLADDEQDLIVNYRQLTPNSKQIVATVTRMELNHIKANAQGENTKIRIIPQKNLDAFIQENIKARKSENQIISRKDEMRYIKVLNQAASAGTGDYMDDDAYEEIAVPAIPRGAEIGYRINGDSMEPKIHDGDIVFVKRQPHVDVGEIGIFVHDGEVFCKQLIFRNGEYYLHSLNKNYEDRLLFGDSSYTIGKVIFN